MWVKEEQSKPVEWQNAKAEGKRQKAEVRKKAEGLLPS
jgi:hypothetical protein